MKAKTMARFTIILGGLTAGHLGVQFAMAGSYVSAAFCALIGLAIPAGMHWARKETLEEARDIIEQTQKIQPQKGIH